MCKVTCVYIVRRQFDSHIKNADTISLNFLGKFVTIAGSPLHFHLFQHNLLRYSENSQTH